MTSFPAPAQVLHNLWRAEDTQRDSNLYVILDSARDPRIASSLPESGAPYGSLFLGDGTPEVAQAAPYLVKLEKDSEYATWLVRSGWGNNWGIFLESRATLHELTKHFRPCLAATYNGKKLFFRYYDPRVLRAYLPACNAEELATIFGPVRRFCLEAHDPEVMLDLRRERRRLVKREIRLYVLDGRAAP